MADREIKIPCGCSCKCGNAFDVDIWLDDFDEFCFISSQASVYYLKQNSFFQVWKARIKAAWYMLMGKEYCLHEICLNRDQFDKLLNTMIKYREESTYAKP